MNFYHEASDIHWLCNAKLREHFEYFFVGIVSMLCQLLTNGPSAWTYMSFISKHLQEVEFFECEYNRHEWM